MNTTLKLVIVVVVLAAAAGVVVLKRGDAAQADDTKPVTGPTSAQATEPPSEGRVGPVTEPAAEQPAVQPRPRLVSLGAGKCIPCKAMEPIREELKAEYAGRLEVVYHDVWLDRAAGEHYGIRLIPTLIYYDAAGNELGRTEGFKNKAQILSAFRQWGVDLVAQSGAGAGT